MALNKERKVLLGLLGSAGLILAIDQFLLGPPSGAEAHSAAATGPTNTPSSPASQAAAPAAPSSRELPADVAERWNDRVDAALSESTLDTDLNPFAEASSRSAELGAPGLLAIEQFVGSHQLSLVMLSGETSMAMVNGKPVRIGDEVAGYRLISVDSRSATFKAGELTARLLLPNQPDERPR